MNATSSLFLIRSMLVLGATLAATGCAVDADAEDADADPADSTTAALMNTGTGFTPGGACTVISGANKGKTGTFDADGDCAGDWGMSECKNADGTDSGKCQAGKIVIRRRVVWGAGTSGALLAR